MEREEATTTYKQQAQPEERTVIDVGVLLGRSWWLYSDGTVQGETVLGMQSFRDFEHFKSFTESSPAVQFVSLSKQPPKELQPGSTKTEQLPNPPPVAVKRLVPRLAKRVINGLAVVVICLSGWMLLSEVIRLEEARKLEKAKLEKALLEEANKLREAKKPVSIDDNIIEKNISAIERLQSVKLLDWTWRAEGYIPIMVASFTVQNTNEFDVKNVEITCELFENTGAFVNRTVTTIYDTVKAKSSKAFDDFGMGIMHYQAIFSVPHPITSNDCRISNFARIQL
jgi:hypothetical protein